MKRFTRTGLIISSFLCFFATGGEAQKIPYTPKPGSAERQAICDGARSFVLSKYATGTLPQPIVFKIEHLSAQDSYCNFEAIPLFKDGSYVGTEYIEDIAFNLCLQRTGESWKVIADLSRTDVPDPAEAAAIKRRLPADFPISLFSPTWRKLLRE